MAHDPRTSGMLAGWFAKPAIRGSCSSAPGNVATRTEAGSRERSTDGIPYCLPVRRRERVHGSLRRRPLVSKLLFNGLLAALRAGQSATRRQRKSTSPIGALLLRLQFLPASAKVAPPWHNALAGNFVGKGVVPRGFGKKHLLCSLRLRTRPQRVVASHGPPRCLAPKEALFPRCQPWPGAQRAKALCACCWRDAAFPRESNRDYAGGRLQNAFLGKPNCFQLESGHVYSTLVNSRVAPFHWTDRQRSAGASAPLVGWRRSKGLGYGDHKMPCGRSLPRINHKCTFDGLKELDRAPDAAPTTRAGQRRPGGVGGQQASTVGVESRIADLCAC
uniref:Uncharacterized protein n=1 Tax=Trichuris muris TaxID=70415 RepID=A0A5S6Q8J0_TRIMR